MTAGALVQRAGGGLVQSGGQRRRGAQLGNLRVRRGRRTQQVVQVERSAVSRPQRPGVLYLILGFLTVILAGTVLLMLPIATEDRESAGFMRALFTSTSAVCVTGLVVTDTRAYWSTFGEVTILALIQLGGLGFMTSSTLLLLFFGRRLSVAQRVISGETTFRLGQESLGDLVRRIVGLTLVTEAAGAVLLIAFFTVHDRSFSLEPAWRGLFTAVSAFNNAGFDIEGGGRSLTQYGGNPGVLLTVAALTIVGGLGYAVVWDVKQSRRWSRFTLNSKIVLLTYGMLMVAGMVVIFASEAFRGGSLASLPLPQAALSAFAESTYARTSGFTAFDLGRVQPEILMFMAALMFIGGASASTAGGIKVTTFSALYFAIIASVRGDEHVHVFGREIPWRQINRALAVALLSVAIVFASGFALHLVSDAPTDHILFEAVSAFATTGLSAGITGTLDAAGQAILVVTMFVGRLGPLTIALALAARFRGAERIRYPEADLSIG
ncbi:MAG: potassium transporter TrkG [Dehalococcoidia bacterium]